MKYSVLLPSLLLLSLFTGCDYDQGAGGQDKALVVFLVRHAEKVDQSRDPELSTEGIRRAEALAITLVDSGIEYIHSTDLIRTRNTAAPIARELDLELNLYDADYLSELIDQMKEKGGRHLVVGHSSTTPLMVELLGGGMVPPIDESDEYDRLYVVTISSEGEVSNVLLRYGKP